MLLKCGFIRTVTAGRQHGSDCEELKNDFLSHFSDLVGHEIHTTFSNYILPIKENLKLNPGRCFLCFLQQMSPWRRKLSKHCE